MLKSTISIKVSFSLSIQVSSEENKTLTKNPDNNSLRGKCLPWTLLDLDIYHCWDGFPSFSTWLVLLLLLCALSKKKWNSQHFHRRRACNVPSENLWNGIKAMTIYVTITAAAGPKNVKSIFFFTRKGHKSRTFMVAERPKLINGILLVSTTVFKQEDDQLK